MSTLVDIHNCACRWAREAGARIRERLGAVRVEHKGAVDLVTDADLDSERHLLSRIGERFSHHSVWAEESGADGTGSAPFRWIVDPLDGTTNFAHQIPHFSVLIAVQSASTAGFRTDVAVAYDPMRDECFDALRDGGTRLNGQPVRVSETSQLGDSSGATGFPYDRWSRDDDNHREFVALNLATQGVRRFGSAGLDLAYVACGRFDYYWESGLKPWDVAGGALLVEEAGGVVSDSFGGGFDPERGDIAVAGRGLHRQLLDALTLARERPINDRCAELKPDGIDNT